MAHESRPVAVLVDAYTTGNFLPPAFDRLGVDLIHVQSTPELMQSMLAPDLSAYRGNLVCADPAVTAGELAAYRPVAVVAGQEPGVPLADELADRLGLPGNGAATSAARRDKYEMIEALRRAGVRCARQFQSGDVEEIVGWAERNGYPVVVKPLASAATDKVAVCHGEAEVRKSAEQILSEKTIYNETNSVVLVQSYLAGTEYVVDTVSYDGKRYVCGVWQYTKRLLGTHNIYDIETLLPEDAHPVPELVSYIHDALDAVGIRFGPAHAEVIMTEDGPALVEVGARLAGNMHPGFHDECLGANQADLTALAATRPDEFLGRWASRCYTKRLEAAVYTAPTTLDGVVDSIDRSVVAEIEALPSVYGVNVKIKEGGRIRPTVDLYTSTLRVFLRADTTEELMRDYERVRELKDRVYRLR
ncbi:ATP-grasp domain-containing protein [Microbispora bryophytorum]|uniref:ATP-grasp domain-containing protein n=1 Tax=Microbispora bryophytorum TaxID=1460882 RepID=UPI0034073606